MSVTPLLLAAALLLLEPSFYLFANRRSALFAKLVRPLGEPVRVIYRAFLGFKLLQLSVFAGWCLHYGEGSLAPDPVLPGAVAVGLLLLGLGQTLNFAVFHQLGRVGAFYGVRYGHQVPWVRGFPFNWLRHPQFVGVSLSIWGLFLALRFPHPDWWLLPAVETAYYGLAAALERSGPSRATLPRPAQRSRPETESPPSHATSTPPEPAGAPQRRPSLAGDAQRRRA